MQWPHEVTGVCVGGVHVYLGGYSGRAGGGRQMVSKANTETQIPELQQIPQQLKKPIKFIEKPFLTKGKHKSQRPARALQAAVPRTTQQE